jgi:hypothetical protein
MLAENGARDYKGHRLCVACWNSRPELTKIHADSKNKDVVHRKIAKKHACEGGACECPCRIMEKEHVTKPKRDLSAQMEIHAGTITV